MKFDILIFKFYFSKKSKNHCKVNTCHCKFQAATLVNHNVLVQLMYRIFLEKALFNYKQSDFINNCIKESLQKKKKKNQYVPPTVQKNSNDFKNTYPAQAEDKQCVITLSFKFEFLKI